MKRYTIENHATHYILGSFDALKDAINFYHKTARRKFGTINLIDNETGEVIKYKLSKVALEQIAQK